jgi:hypothetical protein
VEFDIHRDTPMFYQHNQSQSSSHLKLQAV